MVRRMKLAEMSKDLVWDQRVAGSNPVFPTIKIKELG